MAAGQNVVDRFLRDAEIDAVLVEADLAARGERLAAMWQRAASSRVRLTTFRPTAPARAVAVTLIVAAERGGNARV